MKIMFMLEWRAPLSRIKQLCSSLCIRKIIESGFCGNLHVGLFYQPLSPLGNNCTEYRHYIRMYKEKIF